MSTTVAPPAALALEAVTHALGGRVVLADVDLAVAPGEAIALVGPSGAGKTTALRLLGGAVLPEAGRVVHAGRDLATLDRPALRAARASVGFVHQDLALVPQLRVHQNVTAGRFGRQGLVGALCTTLFPGRAELARVHALLERVGAEELLFRRTDTLSGGQQQRVAIARALYPEPTVLLADEPVASVDPARARAVIDLLVALCAERGASLVVSLHDLELARSTFARLVGLRAGRVVFDERAEALDAADFHALYRLDATDEAP